MDYQIGAVELLGLLLGILFLVIAIIQNKNLLFKNFSSCFRSCLFVVMRYVTFISYTKFRR